jgi:uncharacterized membrane protein YsdA (DUF1294 family)/cold shock CspA family protein
MLHKGKITNWNDNRGFGFIAPNNGGDRVFVHIKAFSEANLRPVDGDVVVYSITKDGQGRMQAVNAKFSGNKEPSYSGKRPSLTALVFASLFFVAIAVSVRETGLPQLVLIAYAVISAITFIAYAIDKSAAQAGRWRISESTLHLLALAGGWPGALLAQQTLRHKSKKRYFRVVLWITVLLNCAAFAWLHTAEGSAFLQQLMKLLT